MLCEKVRVYFLDVNTVTGMVFLLVEIRNHSSVDLFVFSDLRTAPNSHRATVYLDEIPVAFSCNWRRGLVPYAKWRLEKSTEIQIIKLFPRQK